MTSSRQVLPISRCTFDSAPFYPPGIRRKGRTILCIEIKRGSVCGWWLVLGREGVEGVCNPNDERMVEKPHIKVSRAIALVTCTFPCITKNASLVGGAGSVLIKLRR